MDGKVLFFGTGDDPWEALDDYNHFVKTGRCRTSPNKSTKPRSGEKPRPKPPSGCPLKAAGNGMWVWYNSRAGNPTFGSWKAGVTGEDAWEAFRVWQRTGEKPNSQKLKVGIAANVFLTDFKKKVQTKNDLAGNGRKSKSRSPWTFLQYKAAAELMIEHLGRDSALEDIPFQKWKKLREAIEEGNGDGGQSVSPYTVKKYLTGVRRILGYAKGMAERSGQSLLLRTGDALDNPDSEELKAALHDRDPKFIRRKELLDIIEAAGPQMKAITLLGLNAGFHNLDFALVEHKHLDLQRGHVFFPRTTSRKPRFATLWPETIAAINEWLAVRPAPSDEGCKERVFVTNDGLPWVRNRDDTSHLTKRYNELLNSIGAKRPGISVGALRHTFKTVANRLGYKEIARIVMGHEEPLADMDEFYVQQLDESFDEFSGDSAEQRQVRECVDAVHDWLFQKAESETPEHGLGITPACLLLPAYPE